MKLLLDQNLSFRLCPVLADLFPDSTHVRLLGLSDASDNAVWEFAKRAGFTLVSLDSDFAERAALLGPPPKLIWLRWGTSLLP
jgi:predicted nuclease of predicted toxin-antitoxin system